MFASDRVLLHDVCHSLRDNNTDQSRIRLVRLLLYLGSHAEVNEQPSS